ncbi:SPOR domain-containing protein [Pseudooceanicola onchidii]|uniref:SPOR domain-containing protein n=1 Tax=Pseudooceanicola onchidii TaxID=2562279 RepID=UPI001F0FC692|nr:SPOR domain-containing protein [Pseudooceanicola onchidii]
MSIALVIGVGVWGYKTMVRDVSDVPVVRAAKDPMRIAPEDPGGTLAGNTGLAVNQVAAEGVAEKPADRLILAPEPIQLTSEDESSKALAEMIAAENRAADLARAAVQSAEATPDAAPDTVSGDQSEADDGTLARLTDMLTRDAKPLSGETVQQVSAEGPIAAALMRAQQQADLSADEPTGPAVEEARPEPVAFSPTNDAVPTTVVRPRMRPGAGSSSGPAAMIAAPSPGMTSVDVDPRSIMPGTRLAQLGAYDSVDIARQEWDRFSGRFSDYMNGKQRVIQEASTGGRTFYRLRVMGFDDLAAARYFCAALVAEQADCIPVVAK